MQIDNMDTKQMTKELLANQNIYQMEVNGVLINIDETIFWTLLCTLFEKPSFSVKVEYKDICSQIKTNKFNTNLSYIRGTNTLSSYHFEAKQKETVTIGETRTMQAVAIFDFLCRDNKKAETTSIIPTLRERAKKLLKKCEFGINEPTMEALDYFMGGHFYEDFYKTQQKIIVPQDVHDQFCALFVECNAIEHPNFDAEAQLKKYYFYTKS